MIFTALVWCERLLALAILFQTIEMLKMSAVWSETSGIWRWSTLQKGYAELPENVQRFFNTVLCEEAFHKVLLLRLICCIGVWLIPSTLFLFVLLFSTWLISVRWRGIFNGGSDSMTVLIAASLFVAQFFSHHVIVVKACLAYIAVQLTASYFVAGLSKIKNDEWRRGTVISAFFHIPRYDSPPEWIKKIMDHPKWAKWVSYSVMAFQLSFPLAWLSPSVCMLFFWAGMAFHVMNFWVFGLNRFVFAWLAAYPALYFWSARGTQ